MRVLSRFFFVILLFQAFITKSAFAEPASCGFTQSCDKAMVCVGATGTANDGQCILSPLVLSVCTVFNEIQDFTVYFMIFAVVALGFAFFLGKISWGMIISVILGITMIKGAILITQKTTGISGNYCDVELVQYSKSCKGAAWTIVTSQTKTNTTAEYNTEATQLCPNPMTCTKQTCIPDDRFNNARIGTNVPNLSEINKIRTQYDFPPLTEITLHKYLVVANGRNGPIANSPYLGYTDFLPPNSGKDVNTIYFIPTDVAVIAPSLLPNDYKLFMQKCTVVPPPPGENYLVCKNSCTGVVKNVATTATTCAGAGLV